MIGLDFFCSRLPQLLHPTPQRKLSDYVGMPGCSVMRRPKLGPLAKEPVVPRVPMALHCYGIWIGVGSRCVCAFTKPRKFCLSGAVQSFIANGRPDCSGGLCGGSFGARLVAAPPGLQLQ